ncbi:MAG: hypothetical protein ACE37M_04990 [Henriciella sp.]
MGTSANNPGPNPRSPLVPPHADSTPDEPVPPRPEHGLRKFRTSLSKWVSSGGGRQALPAAVANYVGGALGGASTGTRRFGAATNASAAAIAGMAGLGGLGGEQTGDLQAQLSEAIGQPIEVAASIIARVVAPDNSEGDHVIAVIQDSIIEACEDADEFELDSINEDFLREVLIRSLIEMIYHDLAERIGGASLDKAESPSERQARENELHDFISETVEQQLATTPSDEYPLSDQNGIRDFQLTCIERVLESWEE